MQRLLVVPLALALVAVAALPARAQDPARYQTAIDRALQEFSSGHYEEARAFFRQAHREIPNPRTLRGIAMASYELRDYLEAYRSLKAALEFGPSDRDLTPEHRAAAMQLLDRTRALIGVVGGVPEGAAVRLDGAEHRVEPDGTVLLPLGAHTLAVELPDGRRGEQRFEVAGGEDLSWTAELTGGAQASVIPPEREPTPVDQVIAAQSGAAAVPTAEPAAEPVAQPEPQPDEGARGIPRLRLHLMGFAGVGSYSSAGESFGGVPAGGAIGALLQIAEVFAIGVQVAGSYASLFEENAPSDTAYWAQIDALAWGELRLGALGIGVGLGGVVGIREGSTFVAGFREIGTRVDGAFGLVGDVRVYFADDLLFVAAEGRFAFGDYGAMAGVLAFGVEPLR